MVGFDEHDAIRMAFDGARTKTEAARALGIDFNKMSGTRLNCMLEQYAEEISYDLASIKTRRVDDYNKECKKCKWCGAEIEYKRRRNDFCSQSCATKYNNSLRPPKSDEVKEKISTTLLKRNKWSDDDILRIKKGELKNTRKKISKVCPTCHKEFKGTSNQIYCSCECAHNSHEYKEKMREKQLELIRKGKHKGWCKRKQNSYAERFWMKVLDNNNIAYVREYYVAKKYFLDFFINKNGVFIDLEIDGRQHKEKIRHEHDNKRDTYIMHKLGFIVYRVCWNEINTTIGKTKMREKIDNFLAFYNSL